ncbi:hypothetical protein G7B40_041170 [Aetokthonos hydrillicola Thurmond2011]|jgi:hypothetical protein|uniref:Uncharacterized protein n=1 Tax=Aetokthonos hydrillicola Thurmond2011 TaxID=2712845 RepID=A0AAP5IGD7_9CYAN|nr:hypothetical protein [Aetokthonos hydrillicola]MBW4591130.1 hypothetical protein [Aetokthonos hydrillicola CCALA 1050]MDR9900899.1 hypothetical protein [Aetokthonos hydrillicola Thurmond2011]
MDTSKDVEDMDFRKEYQRVYGCKIRFDTWQRIKVNMGRAGMPINKENIRVYANFRRLKPKSNFTAETLERIRKFVQSFPDRNKTFYGFQLYNTAIEINPDLKKNTFFKYFQIANSQYDRFSETYEYSYDDAFKLILCTATIDSNKFHPSKKRKSRIINLNGK